jgi:hypothetical protein
MQLKKKEISEKVFENWPKLKKESIRGLHK